MMDCTICAFETSRRRGLLASSGLQGRRSRRSERLTPRAGALRFPSSDPWTWRFRARCFQGRLGVGLGGQKPPGRCRSASVRGTLGVTGHEIAPAMGTPPIPHVAGALSVAPRPAKRGCRSALLGRGWERPPISACLDRHRGGWSRTAPSSPPLRGRSQPAIPCGKAKRRAGPARPGLGRRCRTARRPAARPASRQRPDARLRPQREPGRALLRRLGPLSRCPALGKPGLGAAPHDPRPPNRARARRIPPRLAEGSQREGVREPQAGPRGGRSPLGEAAV